jgi:hypothetical protein
MTDKKKPFARKKDRAVQLRMLLRNKVKESELADMGFTNSEVVRAKISLQNKETPKRAEYTERCKDPARCKQCRNMGSERTFTNGVCMACTCRDRVNYERKGMWRV